MQDRSGEILAAEKHLIEATVTLARCLNSLAQEGSPPPVPPYILHRIGGRVATFLAALSDLETRYVILKPDEFWTPQKVAKWEQSHAQKGG